MGRKTASEKEMEVMGYNEIAFEGINAQEVARLSKSSLIKDHLKMALQGEYEKDGKKAKVMDILVARTLENAINDPNPNKLKTIMEMNGELEEKKDGGEATPLSVFGGMKPLEVIDLTDEGKDEDDEEPPMGGGIDDR